MNFDFFAVSPPSLVLFAIPGPVLQFLAHSHGERAECDGKGKRKRNCAISRGGQTRRVRGESERDEAGCCRWELDNGQATGWSREIVEKNRRGWISRDRKGSERSILVWSRQGMFGHRVRKGCQIRPPTLHLRTPYTCPAFIPRYPARGKLLFSFVLVYWCILPEHLSPRGSWRGYNQEETFTHKIISTNEKFYRPCRKMWSGRWSAQARNIGSQCWLSILDRWSIEAWMIIAGLYWLVILAPKLLPIIGRESLPVKPMIFQIYNDINNDNKI